MSYWWLFLFTFIAYMIGNINFSIIISRVKFKDDVRSEGSGNPGATNMLRKFGAKWAVLILILDMIKGAIPAFMGLFVFGGFNYSINPVADFSSHAGMIGMYACGFAAVVGHCFPVIGKFKGGKGVSTSVGVFFAINPAVAAVALLIGIIYGSIWGYASISSFMFITIVVLWEGFMRDHATVASIILMTMYFFILFMHRKNIYRLLRGCENRAQLFKKRSKK